ncbi:carbohydrate ABC transporter permease [Dactylosporangium sp. CS-047395]|uniref:carbohydrate ABC transporter permease n=1 Tax=Dactylosporangium sp. CS-047395 TaxID=3239936 RepID=UPI003D8D345E
MRLRPARLVLNAALMIVALGWLAPLALAVYASLRPYEETSRKGYFSWPDKLTLHYYAQVWDSAELPKYFTNSLIVAVPGVILTLFLASFVAFCIARLRIRFSLPLLVVFTAGNLLPPQVLVTPLYEMYKQIPLPAFVSESGTLYDSYAGLILIHVAFQVGFCVFVLSNFMRTLPTEITEAAVMDGAGVWLQYWKVTLPLCRPALAALATLLFTWIYNDFLYALVLISTGDKLPVTSALNNLRGQFFTDYNLLAAGSLLVALPTLIVFFALQRQFVAGLTLGAAKG